MIDVSAWGGEGVGRARVWLALCGGGGMLPLLTPPKPVNQEAVFTMPGRAGRQSYGTERDRA